jgi:hypothetical protein
MSVRNRSQSRSRVVKKSDLFASGESLDPYALLDGILNQLVSVDVPLSVKLTDGETSVAFNLNTFLGKEYEVKGDLVKLGFKSLKIRHLKASISFDVELVDDQPET